MADRAVMVSAAALLTVMLAGLATWGATAGGGRIGWTVLLLTWPLLGIAYSMSVTPSGRLLRRSASAGDRPALFAAQFALSHCAWLICYPLVGLLGASIGQTAAFEIGRAHV